MVYHIVYHIVYPTVLPTTPYLLYLLPTYDLYLLYLLPTYDLYLLYLLSTYDLYLLSTYDLYLPCYLFFLICKVEAIFKRFLTITRLKAEDCNPPLSPPELSIEELK